MKVPFFRYDWFFKENRDIMMAKLDAIMSSGQYVNGEYTRKLEQKLAEICDRKHAVATGSCTDALFFALQTAGIKQGDEVILPPFSFVATLDSVLRCGATPVFVDISAEHFMLDIDSLEKAVTPRTKAIVLVQLFGNRHPQQEQIRNIAQRHGIPLIEDAAQALGVKPAGKAGNLSCISFDPTKIVSAYGTGGAVLTDDEAEYSMLKKLVNHGFENGIPQIAGYNSKISETQAAMLLAQIEKLTQTIARMTEVANSYYSMLDGIEEIALPQHCSSSNFHKFVIKAEKRDELRIFLKENGIETKIHYPTLLSEQKILDGRKFLKHDLSNAQKVTKKVLSLPIWPSISEAETLYVCECIKRFYVLS